MKASRASRRFGAAVSAPPRSTSANVRGKCASFKAAALRSMASCVSSRRSPDELANTERPFTPRRRRDPASQLPARLEVSVAQQDKAELFRKLHAGPRAFVIPNPWDAGSARILAGLGFQALATSSGAEAGVLGRRDGTVSRDEALAHARAIVGAVDLPVSADLEKCFGDA